MYSVRPNQIADFLVIRWTRLKPGFEGRQIRNPKSHQFFESTRHAKGRNRMESLQQIIVVLKGFLRYSQNGTTYSNRLTKGHQTVHIHVIVRNHHEGVALRRGRRSSFESLREQITTNVLPRVLWRNSAVEHIRRLKLHRLAYHDEQNDQLSTHNPI